MLYGNNTGGQHRIENPLKIKIRFYLHPDGGVTALLPNGVTIGFDIDPDDQMECYRLARKLAEQILACGNEYTNLGYLHSGYAMLGDHTDDKLKTLQHVFNFQQSSRFPRKLV